MKKLLSLLIVLILFSSCSRLGQKNLTVKSHPTNAEYLILSSGRRVAKGTTPSSIRLKSGAYTVVIKKNGYKDFPTEIVIKKGSHKVISPNLLPVPGRLVINSFPQNAKLYVDSRFQGRTPRVINNMNAGYHKIDVSLSGYTEHTDTVLVLPGETKKMNITLFGGAGRLQINLNKIANVYIDGNLKEQNNKMILNLKAGLHQVFALKEGYIPVKKDVVVYNKRISKVNLILKKAENMAELHFYIRPAGAQLFIDRIKISNRSIRLPWGSYRVEAKMPKYRSFIQFVKIKQNKQTVKIKLNPLPGNISINSIPSAGEVYLNGELMGVTPLILNEMDAGIFGGNVKKRGFDTFKWRFKLPPQGSRSFNIILKKHFNYILRKSFIHIQAAPSGFISPNYAKVVGNKYYISDNGNARIIELDASGIVQKIYKNKIILKDPVAFYIDVFKDVFIVDKRENRVIKLDKQGVFLQYYGGYGSDKGLFNAPTDIAAYKAKYIYIVDSKNNRVQIFNTNMKFLTAFGIRGTGIAQFMNPLSIAVHNTAGVFVTDPNRKAILRFSYLGIFEKEVVLKIAPEYISVEPNGNLLVTMANGKIRLFNIDLAAVDTLDIRDITLYSPGKVGIAPDYSIVVPDSENDKVYSFARQWDAQYYK